MMLVPIILGSDKQLCQLRQATMNIILYMGQMDPFTIMYVERTVAHSLSLNFLQFSKVIVLISY